MTKPSKGNSRISKKTKGLEPKSSDTLGGPSEEQEFLSQEFGGLAVIQADRACIREEMPRYTLEMIDSEIQEVEGIDPTTLHDHKKYHKIKTS